MIENSPAAAIRVEGGTSRDLDAVIHVMDAAFDERFGEGWTRSQCAGILPMPGVSLTVVRNGEAEEVVGFALFRLVGTEGELLLLAVAPRYRRRGIGWALLHQFLAAARSTGVSRVHLEVRDGNPAVDMYHAAGFSAAGRRRKYYRGRTGGEFDALTLARDL